MDNKDRDDEDKKGPGKKSNLQTIIMLLIAAAVTFTLMSIVSHNIGRHGSKELPYNEFMKLVDQRAVESVNIGNTEIKIKVKKDTEGYDSEVTYISTRVDEDPGLIERLYNADVKTVRQRQDMMSFMLSIVSYFLPFIIIFAIMQLFIRRMGSGGIMGMNKSNAKVYVQKETGVTFKDVAGADEAKESLTEIVDFLHNPAKFNKIGARLPKGALLVGPPGTGKTLLAKAVAGEANVPFFSLSGSDFVEMFVGLGASRVRSLFKQAQEQAPCIIFIDEIDAIGKSRDSRMGGNDEREQTLNQLLSEMDGFDSSKGLLILAATNRPDILDPAILRPGRFDRKITVSPPDVKGREEILKVHAKDKPMSDDVDLVEIAKTTSGFTGADLENLLNEAAILAAKSGKKYISNDDIKQSFIKVGIGTEKKSKVVSDKERKITAYHEAGHAILFRELPDVGPVHTISIIPTGMGAAGYTMPLPEEDYMFNTKSKMLNEIKVSLGGRIAEELIFGDVTTGASGDIKQATKLAKAMVMKYGMSDKLGMINYESEHEEIFIGRDIGHTKTYADDTARIIDEEIRNIIDSCYEEAKQIIISRRNVLDKCCELLLEKEKIGYEEFEALFND